MTILDQIIDAKKKAVQEQKKVARNFEAYPLFSRQCISLSARLNSGETMGIIAEFKRRSPSKGIINDRADVGDVVKAYEKYSAAGISVLTDEKFFGGSIEDFDKARKTVGVPLLRKDFIVDEYQLLEAKAIGADVILLIAACLTASNVRQLAKFAVDLGLEVLLELHDEEEIDHICDEVTMIGVNNRNLKTFAVDNAQSIKLAAKIPNDKIKIAESGIRSVDDILLFSQYGFKGFLIGELFMKQPDPTIAFADFVKQLKAKAHEN